MDDLRELMGQLHLELTKKMAKILEGEPTAAELSAIRQFLKDNDIDVDTASKAGKPIIKLADNLPFDEDDPLEEVAQ